jgi:hypothetical protein
MLRSKRRGITYDLLCKSLPSYSNEVPLPGENSQVIVRIDDTQVRKQTNAKKETGLRSLYDSVRDLCPVRNFLRRRSHEKTAWVIHCS